MENLSGINVRKIVNKGVSQTRSVNEANQLCLRGNTPIILIDILHSWFSLANTYLLLIEKFLSVRPAKVPICQQHAPFCSLCEELKCNLIQDATVLSRKLFP